MWHAKPGTDYGPVVPGFDDLEACHHAGVSMTMAELWRTGQVDNNAQPAPRDEDAPWFECAAACRPYDRFSFLRVCKVVKRYRGLESFTPR